MKLAPTHLRVKLYGTFVDPDHWIESGLYSFFRLRDVYGMKPHHHMLDLGCGCGRVALPVISFLNEQGHYYGLDVDQEMMDWCNANFGSATMSFDWANVKNSLYFGDGAQLDSEYKFPYPDNTLDFGFGFSIFTHLLEPGTRNYLSELSRTMKVGGKFMFSTFLLDEKTQASVDAGKSAWRLQQSNSDICKYDLPQTPEATVAFTRDGMEAMLADYGFRIESFVQGNWFEVPHGSHDEVFIVRE